MKQSSLSRRKIKLTRDISLDEKDRRLIWGVWSISRSVVQPLFRCIHKSSSAMFAKFSGMGLESRSFEQFDLLATKTFDICLRSGVLNSSGCSIFTSSYVPPAPSFCCNNYTLVTKEFKYLYCVSEVKNIRWYSPFLLRKSIQCYTCF